MNMQHPGRNQEKTSKGTKKGIGSELVTNNSLPQQETKRVSESCSLTNSYNAIITRITLGIFAWMIHIQIHNSL